MPRSTASYPGPDTVKPSAPAGTAPGGDRVPATHAPGVVNFQIGRPLRHQGDAAREPEGDPPRPEPQRPGRDAAALGRTAPFPIHALALGQGGEARAAAGPQCQQTHSNKVTNRQSCDGHEPTHEPSTALARSARS